MPVAAEDSGPRLVLTKHEGAGNDFLVVVDPDGVVELAPAAVRALCDRRRGVGADGVIVVRPKDGDAVGADLSMVLRNADGSRAEMSGNGIRCLAQAAVLAGLVSPPRFTVATDAGVRSVEYVPGERPGVAAASVDMGEARLEGDEESPVPGRRAVLVDMGNPHLVLLGPDPADLDLAELGPGIEARHPGGINVEFVAAVRPDELTLRVWERGVGETLACGTGSCAAAAVAHHLGLVGRRVKVKNPGGVLEVDLGEKEGDPVVLGGPVRKIADVSVEQAVLG